jgi:formylglycine-generating enzyme required for sulfatase activity
MSATRLFLASAYGLVALAVALPLASGADVEGKKSSPKHMELDLGGGVKMKLVRIEPGKFRMGSSKSEQEQVARMVGVINAKYVAVENQHEVEITKPFYMGVYAVTQAEYEKVMGKNPSYFAATGGGKDKVSGLDTARFPVERVGWDEAVDFCRKVSQKAGKTLDLPTEAEWEYACRAGTAGPFHYGASLSSKQANFNGNKPYGGADKGPHLERTTQVGTYEANAFGLFDMHGNVWQWCKDWWGLYAGKNEIDPQGPASGKRRVVRGGTYYTDAWLCRSAFRTSFPPDDRDGPNVHTNRIGFRVLVRLP